MCGRISYIDKSSIYLVCTELAYKIYETLLCNRDHQHVGTTLAVADVQDFANTNHQPLEPHKILPPIKIQ
jgi:hypothetical protein